MHGCQRAGTASHRYTRSLENGMVAEPASSVHHEATAPEAGSASGHAVAVQSPVYAPPNPCLEATRFLQESHDLMAKALEVVDSTADYGQASDLIGQGSDRIGSALHFMRQALRR